jgi:hypothetical protein
VNAQFVAGMTDDEEGGAVDPHVKSAG